MDAERVGGEGVAPARVVEGINHDLGRIIGEDIFPARHARADLFGFFVPADEHGVEIMSVVGEIGVGILGGLGAIRRLTGDEPGDLQHVLGHGRDRMHAFEVCQPGRSFDAGNLNNGRSRERSRREQ